MNTKAIILGLGNPANGRDNGMSDLLKLPGSQSFGCQDKLPEGLDTFYVHSMGLRSALGYIQAHPNQSFKLYCVEGVPDYFRWLRSIFSMYETVSLPKNVSYCENYLCGNSWGVTLTVVNMNQNRYYPKYGHDSLVPVAVAAWLKAQV